MTSPALLLAVVDDDRSVRDSLRGLLASFGYEVAVFASGADFLASTALTKAHCLVLDVRMPEMTGPELQRHLAALGSRLPIVFITSDTDARLRASVLAAGAVDVLIKPFDDDSLLRALNSATLHPPPKASP